MSQELGTVHDTGKPLPPNAPPTTLDELKMRIFSFQQGMGLLEPPASKNDRCPGLLSETCGHELHWEAFPARQHYCYRCTRPGCLYREWVPPPKPVPEIEILLLGADTIQVSAAQGAESAVRFCGGIQGILAAHGIDCFPSEQHSASADVVELPFAMYSAIVQKLRASDLARKSDLTILPETNLVPLPTIAAYRQIRQLTEAEAETVLLDKLDTGLVGALLPFQRDGICTGLQMGGRVLIADEMGVGKTLQAIGLAACYKEEWPVLIITPASLRLAWAEELERWLPGLRPSSIHIIESRNDRVVPPSLPLVTITSYEMLQRLSCDACRGRSGPLSRDTRACTGRPAPGCPGAAVCIAAMGWKVVIADESHTLRTASTPPDAYHTEATISVTRRARRAIFLTGTPSLSKPFDLYRQVDALAPGLLGPTRQHFASTYCGRRLVQCHQAGGWRPDKPPPKRYDNSGLRRGPELHRLLRHSIMLRRLKAEVLDQLPAKRRQVVRLPIAKAPSETLDQGGGNAANSAAHQTGIRKLPSAIEWLRNLLGQNEPGADDIQRPKVLVFAHHRAVMNGLAAAMDDSSSGRSVGYVLIDGQTDPEDRQLAARRFRQDSKIEVALLSVQAAGVGLDFSAATAVVFVELPDEVGILWQAEARAHRQGLRWPINVYFLCGRGSSDERTWQRLHQSLARVNAVHDGTADADQPSSCWEPETEDGLIASSGQRVTQLGLSGRDQKLEEWIKLRRIVEETIDTSEPQWAFEVSRATQRLHFHGDMDGSRPLQLSLPMELLLPEDGPSSIAGEISEWNPLQRLWMRLRPSCWTDACEEPCKAMVHQGIGLVSLQPWAVDQLDSNCGVGKQRFLTQPDPACLPNGAKWHVVTVHHSRWNRDTEHRQAVDLKSGVRYCMECFSPIVGSEKVPAHEILSSTALLFCSGPCEEQFATKRRGSVIRRALFKLERGVCTEEGCKLDCHALVRRLQSVERGTFGWESKRREIVKRLAPAFYQHGAKLLLDRLVQSAVEGNAWQADHIIPVYQGGGGCGLENLRTLCVLCHKKVTILQAKQRGADRQALRNQLHSLRAVSKKQGPGAKQKSGTKRRKESESTPPPLCNLSASPANSDDEFEALHPCWQPVN